MPALRTYAEKKRVSWSFDKGLHRTSGVRDTCLITGCDARVNKPGEESHLICKNHARVGGYVYCAVCGRMLSHDDLSTNPPPTTCAGGAGCSRFIGEAGKLGDTLSFLETISPRT